MQDFLRYLLAASRLVHTLLACNPLGGVANSLGRQPCKRRNQYVRSTDSKVAGPLQPMVFPALCHPIANRGCQCLPSGSSACQSAHTPIELQPQQVYSALSEHRLGLQKDSGATPSIGLGINNTH